MQITSTIRINDYDAKLLFQEGDWDNRIKTELVEKKGKK